MALKDTYDFDMLVNEAEGLVLTELEAQMSRSKGLCTCQDCVLDMAAYALNKVRPSYRASLMGSVYAKGAAPAGLPAGDLGGRPGSSGENTGQPVTRLASACR